ncbi:uncharacterized protein FA14DRAFT_143920 [Meira miltonrushii]|uniref:P-loop containing nucleoside triphosphate hydrolase protein n=1 Tax=Meira miltonrushii TaxID=1280837 RepID=A0A316VAQ4_9BASI|nr:uncharacterized protein FA14DRAFT_143920 [Meira miltonrushii]PWN34606.1 hypothetical protein FA14DRAFT_143920 [Meira miltonrushii]
MSSTTTDRYPPRRWYRRVPFIPAKPRTDRLCEPLDRSDDDDTNDADKEHYANPVFPEMNANWLSLVSFQWLSRILSIGYTRPLQADELYSMPQHRRAKVYADRLEQAWERRTAEAKARNAQPHKDSIFDALPSTWRKIRGGKPVKKKHYEPSLTWSLNEVAFSWFWMGGAFKFIGDMSLITSPLLVRSIIETLGDPSEQAMSKGFGLGVGLFLLLALSVIGNVHGFYRSYSTGIALRGALIHTVYRRATNLSEKARVRDGGFGTGKLVSLVSADVSRIDFVCGYFHMGWTSLFQIAVVAALVIWSLGYSALPGLALIALLYPLQNVMVRKLFQLRRRSLVYTDARIKAVVEAIASIRLIKTYAWEPAVLSRISKARASEMGFLRKRLILRAVNTAVSFTAPTLAAVVSFVCYSAVGNTLDAGPIFSTLTFFLLLRTPLQMLPVVLSALADARAAVDRLQTFMQADLRSPYDVAGPQITPKDEMPQKGDMVSIDHTTFAHHDDDDDEKTEKPTGGRSTRLHIDSFHVKAGQLACIVGPVGSGKSSLLRALIGDMQVAGEGGSGAKIAGKISYCPQQAWLLSSSVRDNIVFGRHFDQRRYDDVLERCSLHADLATLSHGDETVVGEKGISLSGGQKQRISLARALYSSETKLKILDDCFSALDAHVGKEVFEQGILQSRRYGDGEDSTCILVTHSLSLLPRADVIFYLDEGRIAEQGTFSDLMQKQDGYLAELVQQHGAKTGSRSKEEEDLTTNEAKENKEVEKDAVKKPEKTADIMQKEERLVGSVTAKTYINYVLLGHAPLTVPLFVVSIIAYQGTTIMSPFWLNWWQGRTLKGVSNDTYMGVYAALGIGQSLGLFCMSASFALFAFYVSNELHSKAAKRILLAPIAFFDTTPQGRITHRFSKDIDAIDNVVGETLRLFISTTVQAFGSIILVAIILPYFLAIAAVVVIAYVWTGMFYRPSSRELRRLNNVLRSKIYEHFSESLSGLATLRAYDALPLFVQENGRRIDSENKAYWLSIACQRWLNIRLDMFGALLCLGTAMLVVGLRGTISPGSGGVVLSYMVTVQSVFGQMIRQSAEIENNMNSIERVLHYANSVEQEKPHNVKQIDEKLKADQWPQEGHLQLAQLTASHREGLPPALKEVSLDIKPGQKIGVVGRTGAGKTTLLSALLRMMEATNGSISIDNQDISQIGLSLLRQSISVISQDAVLFKGSLRYNLDPFEEHDDVHLWQALKSARLAGFEEDQVTQTKSVNSSEEKIEETSARKGLDLDMDITEEGNNLSQGQRALVSIARALVKQAKIVVLDEATASVDSATDAHIQTMLQTSLKHCTVITVAHRLDTVVGRSDAICVMDQGRVAEYDNPINLFRQNGIFTQLCTSASIDEISIIKAQQSSGR